MDTCFNKKINLIFWFAPRVIKRDAKIFSSSEMIKYQFTVRFLCLFKSDILAIDKSEIFYKVNISLTYAS